MQCLNGPASQTSWTDQLDRSAGQIRWTDPLDGPAERPNGQTSFFIWSLGQFAYSKIFLSVCTLSQFPSPTKALLYNDSNNCYQKVYTSNSKGFRMSLKTIGNKTYVWMKGDDDITNQYKWFVRIAECN